MGKFVVLIANLVALLAVTPGISADGIKVTGMFPEDSVEKDNAPALIRSCGAEMSTKVSIPTFASATGGALEFSVAKELPYCGSESLTYTLTSENATHLNDTNRNGFRPGGFFKIGNHFYNPEEYCISTLNETTLTVQYCSAACDISRPCIPKCFPPDQVLSFRKDFRGPESSGSVQYQPRIHSNVSGRPHFFQRHPRNLNCRHYLMTPYSKTVAEKFAAVTGHATHYGMFQIHPNGDVYVQTDDEYKCMQFQKLEDETFCVDGIQDFGLGEKYTNDQDHWIYFACTMPDLTEARKVSEVYGIILILSSNFLLLVVIIYALLWNQQYLHGWTIMAHSSTVFCAYVFMGVGHILASGVLGESSSTSCYVIGVLAYYFFLSKFIWLTILNFHLWWTFRAVRAQQQHTTKQMMVQIYVGWGVPLTVVAVAVVLEVVIGKECSAILLPRFGEARICFITPSARGPYLYYPVAFTLIGNVVLFFLTCHKLYGYSRLPTISRNQLDRHKMMIILFLKMFVVMGVTWIFEFISWLAGEQITWYWVMLDIINVLQAAGIFVIYVCKKDIWVSLEAKYPKLASTCFPLMQRFPCCQPLVNTRRSSAMTSEQKQLRSSPVAATAL